jgi:hypothetical protein
MAQTVGQVGFFVSNRQNGSDLHSDCPRRHCIGCGRKRLDPAYGPLCQPPPKKQDFADACVFVLENYDGDQHLNIGLGEDVSIAEFARLVADTVGYEGGIVFDARKPDGTPRKLVGTSRLTVLGWQARTSLREGLSLAYRHFLAESVDRKEV